MALKPAHLQWSDDGILRSLDFNDIYFQPGLGPEESYYVFLEKNRLRERFSAADDFRIAELGFGSGLNFLLTAKLWRETAPPPARLTYVSVEKHPVPAADLKRIFSFWPELRASATPLLAQYPPLIEGFHHLHFPDLRIHLMLLFGDVADVLPEVRGAFDAWYLDGFAPAKNPGMWEDRLFPLIAARTRPGGTLSSFSSAGAVRRGLQAAGFAVEKAAGFGVKRDMTVAAMPGFAPASSSRRSVAVLGAGIAGASAAYALAQKGHDVTVIERRPPPEEISVALAGIVYPKLTVDPSPMGTFHRTGFCFTRGLLAALNIPSWRPCGVTHLDISAEDEKRHRTLAGQGYPEDFLTYDAGLRLPMAGCVNPVELCRALLDHPNIKTLYSTDVNSLKGLGCDDIVVALGNGSKGFPETAWLPLQSLRGQISCLKLTTASEKMSGVICHAGYITPAIHGIHYAGATFQKEEPASPEVRAADHLENLEKLNRFLPALGFDGNSVVGGRTGYRAATPDRLPLVGAAPDYDAYLARTPRAMDGLYVSTGFGSHGLSGAPLAGEMIACLISGDPMPVPASLAPYLAPERFILRDIKRGKI